MNTSPISYLFLSFQEGFFSFKYLGATIAPRRVLNTAHDDIIKKINSKLANWKPHCLSQASRLVLIKYVLTSIPIHTLRVTWMHDSIIRKIESFIPCNTIQLK